MGEATGSSTHDLLLALAGQVDDDLLAWARELVAVGENTRAIALVTAAVTADRTSLPAPLRAELVAAARAARTDLDADAALPEAADIALDHRFAASPAGGDDRVADVVGALPARMLDGAEVRLTWRLTPAGSAPGPLPHPVVLVEVGPGGRPADVLAYQLSVALDRSGVVASVEVLTSGTPLPAYHAAAVAAATRIHEPAPVTSSVAVPPVVPEIAEPAAPEPLPEPGYADLWDAQGPFAASPEPSEPDATATDPTGGVVGAGTPPPRPVPLRPTRDTEEPDASPAPRPQRRRTTVTPLARSALPSPVPLARRDGSRLRPLVPVADEAPDDTTVAEAGARTADVRRPDGDVSPLEQGQVPALADTPMFRSMQDPLSGPLNAPLLAPLLDPTPVDRHDTPVEDRVEDLEHDDDPFGLNGISPLAPDRPTPAPAEDRWASEWTSGDWAVSSSDLSEPSSIHRHAGPGSGSYLGADGDETPRHRAGAGPAEEAPDRSRFTPQARPAPVEPPPVDARPAAPRPVTPERAAGQVSGTQPTAAQSSAGRSAGDEDPTARTSDTRSPTAQLPAARSATPQPLPAQTRSASALPPSTQTQSTQTQSGQTQSGQTQSGQTPSGQTPSGQTPSGQTPSAQTPSGQPPSAAPWPSLARPVPVTPPSPVTPPTRQPEPPRTPAAAAEPAHGEQDAEGGGLQPDSVGRLSDADRELLARLQAELGTGTRPRASRRAGVAPPNGTPPATNGSGRHDPPDLAG